MLANEDKSEFPLYKAESRGKALNVPLISYKSIKPCSHTFPPIVCALFSLLMHMPSNTHRLSIPGKKGKLTHSHVAVTSRHAHLCSSAREAFNCLQDRNAFSFLFAIQQRKILCGKKTICFATFIPACIYGRQSYTWKSVSYWEQWKQSSDWSTKTACFNFKVKEKSQKEIWLSFFFSHPLQEYREENVVIFKIRLKIGKWLSKPLT